MFQKYFISYYKDPWSGIEPAKDWLASLKDQTVRTIILSRIQRVIVGNFGDCKSVGEGVFELRIRFGPGYRVYYALEGQRVVVLLTGGDKSTQSRDIMKSREYWHIYQQMGVSNE